MIEIPPKFAGQPPVNPEARGKTDYTGEWKGARGLAEDVRYYGEWMKKEAFKRIGHLYPKVKVPDEQGGGEATVIAWIWARTVKCPNPACGCEMPLASSFELSKKKGREAYIQPIIEGKKIRYEVRYGKNAPKPPKIARGAKFKCICCGEPTMSEYIKGEAKSGRIDATLIAIVTESRNGRLYLSPDEQHITAAKVEKPANYPSQKLANDPRNIWCLIYGLDTFDKLFTNRQLTALTTFSDLVVESQTQIEKDGGSKNYARSIGIYLAFIIDKVADRCSVICSWINNSDDIRPVFARQAIPMVWDFAESNPFSNSVGCWSNMIGWITNGLIELPCNNLGKVKQLDAQSNNGLREIMISTDPPYYDNIDYADLSDFYYVWLRQTLQDSYPELFRTMLVPKEEELVATPYRFEGGKAEARKFFEEGMLKTFKQIYQYAKSDVPVSVYYAYKQSEDDSKTESASTGWETMLTAMVQAGFTVTGTWPMHTERNARPIGNGFNALASSIVLVCRKRPADAPVCTRRDFINALKRELKPALTKLQASNIAPVDLAQSAIGPGMGVYSRFSKVLEADGTPMSVRSALQIINQELDLYFTEQDSELDRDSRFCVDLFSQYGLNEVKFGEADVLARAKNTSVEKLAGRSILYAQKGVVRLLSREEIAKKADRDEQIIWLLTQQLTRAMDKDGIVGTARIVAGMLGSNVDFAKSLAYRLFTIADRKGWAQEAYAYNSLVIAWPEVQSKAAELQVARRSAKPKELFDNLEE
jgi:putative DNA methylase